MAGLVGSNHLRPLKAGSKRFQGFLAAIAAFDSVTASDGHTAVPADRLLGP